MEQFKIHILASDNAFYEGPCESLIVPTIRGQYGILAGHSNLISAVAPGKLVFRVPGGGEQVAAVSAGIVKVEKNEVLVLVDTAERPEEIDENRARRAAEEAKEAMLQKRSIQEYRSAQMHLARALNRLKVKKTGE
ncbi:MAG: ATP synthase F1 subunit epsilon [Lachnospiraceae bacterium]|nr:ATP synthase F1 subunit epsilon [Lachnospiraceae bacterium]